MLNLTSGNVIGTVMKILMILTSHSQLGQTGHDTGFWLEEFAAPYYQFLDAGMDVVLASPQGGPPPLDPKSKEPTFQTPATDRFTQDQVAQRVLASTLPLRQIVAGEYAGVFYVGGHGPLWDLVEDSDSITLIETFHSANNPIAAVCHASAVLLNAKKTDGRFLIGQIPHRIQ